MLPKLQARFDKLETLLMDSIELLESRSEGRRNAAPSGSWSATQILHHLYISETGTTRYLEKKLQAPPNEIEKSGMAGWVRSMLLRRALRNMKTKFRAPSIMGEIPEQPNYDALKTQFKLMRQELKKVLDSVTKDQINRAYFKHPRAGRINLLQTMDFLEDHFARHAVQISERSA